MQVAAGGSNVGVTERVPEPVQLGPTPDGLCRVGVPQEMWIDPLADTRFVGVVL